MPLAIVVHSVIANQFHRLRIGLACAPPIRTRPRGEMNIAKIRRTAPNDASAIAPPRLVRIQLFNRSARRRKSSKSMMLAARAASRMSAGSQKTNGRICVFRSRAIVPAPSWGQLPRTLSTRDGAPPRRAPSSGNYSADVSAAASSAACCASARSLARSCALAFGAAFLGFSPCAH